jgi:type II secretory pathway component GspD/PulD (secretin)
MRILVVAAITAFAAAAQQPALHNTEPITVIFVNTPFDEVIGLVARYAGIKVQVDDTATRERRATKITVRMKDVTVEEALETITREAGLAYKVVDPDTILIYQP